MQCRIQDTCVRAMSIQYGSGAACLSLSRDSHAIIMSHDQIKFLYHISTVSILSSYTPTISPHYLPILSTVDLHVLFFMMPGSGGSEDSSLSRIHTVSIMLFRFQFQSWYCSFHLIMFMECDAAA